MDHEKIQLDVPSKETSAASVTGSVETILEPIGTKGSFGEADGNAVDVDGTTLSFYNHFYRHDV